MRLVAEVEGEVVGIVGAGAGESSGTAALTSLWVDPRARGKGVGDGLVEAVLDWARTEGLGQVLLWVAEGNFNAERLYERHGFTRTGAVAAVRPGDARLEYEMTARI